MKILKMKKRPTNTRLKNLNSPKEGITKEKIMSNEFKPHYFDWISNEQVDPFYIRLRMLTNSYNENFKSSPIYKILEVRKLIARELLKDFENKDLREALHSSNRRIKDYLIIE